MRMKVHEGTSGRRRWLLAPVAGVVAALAFAAAALASAPSGWTPVNGMSTGRFVPAAAVLHDGRVLVAGGMSSSGSATASAEIYDPAHGTWTPAHDMDVALSGGEAAVLHDGRVLVVGGDATNDPTADVYDPATDTWTPPVNSMQDAHVWGAVLPLPDGRYLIAGGQSMVSHAADIYNPARNSFSLGADLPVSLAAAAVAPLPGGKVLLAGGYDNSQHSVSTAYVYTPAAGGPGSWQRTAHDLSVVRGGSSAVALPSGKVLITGGASSPDLSTATAIRSAELYDPATDAFATTGEMSTGRVLPSLASLGDGRVVAAGGLTVQGGGEQVLQSAEVYAPATGTWSAAGTMSTRRAGFPLLRLGDGDLLAPGGVGTVDAYGAPQTILAATDVFSPTRPPSAPQAVSASAGDGSALVSWAPPASDGGSPVLHYTVTAAPGGAAVTTTDARTVAAVPGLTNGVSYTFTVRAVNALGASAASGRSNAVTPSAPAAPPGVTSPPAKPRDTKAPKVRIHGFHQRMTLKAFRHGVRLRLDPNEATAFDVSLVGSAHRATIARTYNLRLARRHTSRSTRTRTISLKPRKALIGKARRFHVQLRVLATDRAHNRRTITKTIAVGGKR